MFKGWFPSEMTTGGSDENNVSTSQEDSAFQKEMSDIGARVPPGRMGKAEDLASVSVDVIADQDATNLLVGSSHACD
jgi:hypothetical protein